VWHQYTLRLTEGRDRVVASLAAEGIETRVFYPVPLHLQPCFRDLGYRAGCLPESERAAADVLSLPIHPSLHEDAAARVCDALIRALGEPR
jgi:dTDP-4-amino-4,6-dideoxygalactose transaminase